MLSLAELNAWVPLDSLGRLAVAVIGAAVIGWEREYHDKPAGLRTHMMVSLGAAMFVLTAMQLITEIEPRSIINIDPMRVISGIVGGVGFLGAGAIIRNNGSVQGITTAASIWVAAGIGTASGMGMFRLVFCVVFLSLLILGILRALERTMQTARPKSE